ncbi:MAG: VWA domain-containing protein [Armatimonadota bacterium]
MPVALTNPWALLLAPLLGYAWYVTRRSLADLSPFRRRLALGLRTVVMAGLILGLAGTQLVFRSTKQCVLFVVDCSESVSLDDREDAMKFVGEALKGMRSGDSAGIIAFGADAFVERQPRYDTSVEELKTVVAPNFTDIAQAIRLALAAFEEGAQKRIVLITDGNENLGRAVDDAAIAAANEVRIDVVAITPEGGPEVLLDKMVMPGHVKIGEPFEAKVVAVSRQDCEATLTLERDGALIKRQRVSLVKGDNVFTFTDTIDRAQLTSYEARIESTTDTIADNNRSLGFTFVRGKPKVLYIEGDPGESSYLANALNAEKIDTQVRGTGEIPTAIGEFQQYDSIILSDVPAYAMSEQQLGMIRASVRDLGIGLVMIGGEESFGAGGYLGTPVEDALPVTMDLANKKYIPSGAVICIMHSMEFPQGDAWGRKTLEAVLDTLNARDKMGVLKYGMGEEWLFELQRVANRSKLRALINTMTTGDMMAYGPTLKMAYDALKADKDSRVKHIIILSDGDASRPTPQLLASIKAAKITLSTVCIGPHVSQNWQTMQGMAARCGGRAYLVKSGSQIPRIFLKEAKVVRKSALMEDPFFPALTDPGDPILKGVEPTLPQLLGFVTTTRRPQARTSIVYAKNKDPILASWRYGLGRSVAFTSDCKKRWGAYWVEWPYYQKFWSQLVRWTMRRTGKGEFAAQVSVEGGQGHILVDAVDADGNFINFLDIEARVVGPGLEGEKTRLEQTAPGRYEAKFSARQVGQYLVNLTHEDPDGARVAQAAGAVVPYSPEYRDLEANEYLLSRLTDITRGAVLSEPGQVFGGQRQSTSRAQDIWRALIIIALCLLPLDIAVRRIMFDKREFVQAKERAAAYARTLMPGRRRAREAVHTAAMGRLLSRKQKAADQFAAPPADLRGPPTQPVPPTPTAAPQPPPPEQPEEPVAPTEEGDVMARLRRARDRARRQMQERED